MQDKSFIVNVVKLYNSNEENTFLPQDHRQHPAAAHPNAQHQHELPQGSHPQKGIQIPTSQNQADNFDGAEGQFANTPQNRTKTNELWVEEYEKGGEGTLELKIDKKQQKPKIVDHPFR